MMKKLFLIMLAVMVSTAAGNAKVSGTGSEPTVPGDGKAQFDPL